KPLALVSPGRRETWKAPERRPADAHARARRGATASRQRHTADWSAVTSPLLVGKMADHVEPAALLVVVGHDVPRRPAGVGVTEHLVARPREVVPAAVGLEVDLRQLPDLARIVDATL